MSTTLQRIVYHVVIFALLMSVSLTTHASKLEHQPDSALPTANYIFCDIFEQHNSDLELDGDVYTSSFRVLQPLPAVVTSQYVSSHCTVAYSHAYQRGPPRY
ncbi:hypothetical protein [Pseudoalteromonas mariniglutinosa]|uniref:hypothetical protein n=1 Tax=Pseudoalteromonas mariniglutinosa TaxID=206042 RepID=UPI00384FBD93